MQKFRNTEKLLQDINTYSKNKFLSQKTKQNKKRQKKDKKTINKRKTTEQLFVILLQTAQLCCAL